MCVDGFFQLLMIVEGEWPDMMEEYLGGVIPADKDDGERAHYVIRTFQVRQRFLPSSHPSLPTTPPPMLSPLQWQPLLSPQTARMPP